MVKVVYKIKNTWYSVVRFCTNVWWFRKTLCMYVPGDFSCDLTMYQQCLKATKQNMVAMLDPAYNKEAIMSITRAIDLLDIILGDKFMDIVSDELGYTMSSRKVTAEDERIWIGRIEELETAVWTELYDLQKAHVRSWWA